MAVGTIPPSFLTLPEDVTRKIAHYTGALSILAQVNSCFSLIAKKKGDEILRKLITEYGANAFTTAVHCLELGGKSVLAIIDALFRLARKRQSLIDRIQPHLIAQGMHVVKGAIPSEPYDPTSLKVIIDPYLRSESLSILWNALLADASGSLKQKMINVALHDDPLIRAEQMRSFFNVHTNDLASVQKLILVNKGLRVLPAEIRYFTNLTNLDLTKNKLTTLPDLSRLQKLTRLNLNENQFSVFPETIGKLASLRYLSLESNCLQMLSDAISNLKNLRRLYLYNNALSTLPSSIGKLQSLEVLSIALNKLVSLPQEVGDLERLRILMLDGNSLTSLPKSLCEMQSLEEVYVSDNPLDRFPDLVAPKLKYLGCEGNPRAVRKISAQERLRSKSQFLKIYSGLGSEKWKECIDGIFHGLGKYVFNLGLHKKTIEPGFIESMENAFKFLKKNFGKRIDAAFYLELHKVACAHFAGKATHTEIDQKQVGKFRECGVKAQFDESKGYVLTKRGSEEFIATQERLMEVLGPSFSLGRFEKIYNAPTVWCLHYQFMSKEKIKTIFHFFVAEFYSELSSAFNTDDFLTAIAKFIQHLEWLHPPGDGCGRTDTALLNFLLASYADLNPVLLLFPYVSSTSGLDEWVQFLKEGMENWKQENVKQSRRQVTNN